MSCTKMNRPDNMNNVVFNHYNLDLFLNACTSLHTIFSSVEKDPEMKKPYSLSAMDVKLKDSIRKYWRPLQDTFIDDPYTGYRLGNFTDEEALSPAKVFIDICNGLNNFTRDIKKSLETMFGSESGVRDKLKEARGELSSVRGELRDIKAVHRGCQSEIASLREQVRLARDVSNDKSDKITQLQKENTVQLWEREKARVLEEHNKKIEVLEQQVANFKREKDALVEKLTDMEMKLGTAKLKNELRPSSHAPKLDPSLDEVTTLKQHLYIIEKDLRKLDSEMHSQQKYAIGVLQGITQDYETTFGRYMDKGTGNEPVDDITLRRMRALYRVVQLCLTHAKEGKLQQVSADLPDYYIALDRDIRHVPIRPIATRQYIPGRLSPIPKRMVATVPEPTSKAENEQDQRPPPHTSTFSKVDAFLSEGFELHQLMADPHPCLVNPENGNVDHIVVLKNFPHFTREYVKEQWIHFKEYDTNDDGSLDLTELLSGMSKTLGMQFTAFQIKEALREVDIDGNHTIDFYEYMKVADMLLHKTGQSEVFRSKLILQQGRNISKTCIVM